MTNKSVLRAVGLFLALATVLTTCGWLPFVAPVIIHSSPEGAAVYVADSDEPVGVTPYETHIFHPKKEYEVRLDKYHTVPVVLTFDSPKEVYVTLKPKPILVYTKPDAQIFPAGSDKPLGETPLQVEVVAEDRNYVLKAQDYYEQEITIGLSVDNPVIVELAHRPLMTLSASPSGVDIYENGAFLSKAPLSTEIEKPRSFQLRKEGFYKQTIDLTPAQTHELAYKTTVELIPLPVIEIDVTPASAEVYIVGNDKPISKGDIKIQIEKETSFEVKADRYYSETFTVAAKDQLATVKLDPMPYVMIKSEPAGAQVYLDDELIGTTPLEQLVEKETTYKLVQEGYLPQVVVVDGSSESSVIALEEEPPPPPVVTNAPAVEEPAVEESPAGGLPVGLIAGIAIAAIAVAGILIAIAKKKKK